MDIFSSVITNLEIKENLQFFKADTFPTIHPIHWLTSHFAVGGWSPLQRLSGMLTAHMTQIAPQNGFAWHPHRGLEIFTYVIEGELYHEDTTGGKGIIRAGEVQRMFSGNFIQHQELNCSDEFARVIQIWFVAEPEYMGLAPHYEQVGLTEMPARQVGDAAVRDIVGPTGATDAHVNARLTSAILPPGGTAEIERPETGEDLFLYFVDGHGRFLTNTNEAEVDLYDVILATPQAGSGIIQAGDTPLNYLSFYLKPFINSHEAPHTPS